ncbi:MAG: hypothetical protein ACPG3Z_01480, partial [Saprospiraceae bacterium]
FTNDVKNNFVPQIGFSDDDPGNIESIKKFLDKEYEESPVKTYLTKQGILASRIDVRYFGENTAGTINDAFSRRVEVQMLIN